MEAISNTSKKENSLLKFNLNKIDYFPEDVLSRERKTYYDGVQSWGVYGGVPTLQGWVDPSLIYPNIHPFHKEIISRVKETSSKNICEVGAGAGILAKYVYNSMPGILLTCIEGSNNHIEQMKENFKETSIVPPQKVVNATILKAIAQDIPLPDNSFDLVYTCSVIMHIPFLMVPKALMEISRITSRYVLHIENKNDAINTVCIGNQKSDLNFLQVNYSAMYKELGIKTIYEQTIKDPFCDCSRICFLGEKTS